MELSINELSQLTGKDRRTITTKLEDLPYDDGDKGAHLYDSIEALEAIYTRDPEKISLDEARTRQALSQERLNDTKNEDLRRTRIPIDVANAVNDEVFQAISAELKAAKGKTLTEKVINGLLQKLRDIPAKLKWTGAR